MRHRLLTLVLLLSAGSAAAQGSDPYQPGDRAFRDRGRFDIGWIIASFDSDASLDGTSGPGTDINLEDDTGLDKDTDDFYLRGHWRFKPKHRIEGSYYGLRREGKRVIDRDIHWGDETWNVNALVTSEMDASVARLGYAWSFVKKDRVEVALHADATYLETDASLEGMTASGSVAKEQGSVGFPYPSLGLSLEAGAGRHVMFDLRADWFGGVELSGVEASVLAGEIGLRWYPVKHFGVGVHWLLWELDADKDEPPRSFEVDWGWDGATATMSFVW